MSTVPLGAPGSTPGAVGRQGALVALPGAGRPATAARRITGAAAAGLRADTWLGGRWLGATCDVAAATAGLMLVRGTPSVGLLDGLVLAVVWTLLLGAARVHETRGTRFGLEDVRRVGRAGVALALLGWAGLALLPQASPGAAPSADALSLAIATTALTVATRAVVIRGVAPRLPRLSGGRTRVVVAGHPGDVGQVLAALRRTHGHGFEVVAACVTPSPHRDSRDRFADADRDAEWGVPVIDGLDDLDDAVSAHRAQGVIVLPCPQLGAATVRRLGWKLEAAGRHLFIGPGLVDVEVSRTTLAPAGGIPLVHVRPADLHGVRRLVKGCLDRLVAAAALVLLAPLLLGLALAVRADSPGPALFRQVRIGRSGRPFRMLKLRTMSTDAEVRLHGLRDDDEGAGLLFKMRTDPRVTRVGRVLRTYSLDELPQLVNVVRGEMSLVGPRPSLPQEAAAYDGDTHRRLAVKPGLTGLWQVSGRSDLPWEEAVRLDLSYVENWSLALDARIVWRTLGAVLSHRGAY
ncbi:sugar transferase [Nocardioides pacificus]